MDNNFIIDLYSNYLKANSLELSYNLYNFDKNLKLLLLNSLFDIELDLKNIFTNNFVKRYKDEKDALSDEKNYSNNIMVPEIINRLKKQLCDYEISSKEEKFYQTKYGYIPISSYIKKISFGLLRDLYYISKTNDKDYMRKQLVNEDVSSRDLETILEFLAKIRNICCHNEILFSWIDEEIMIPSTKYHEYFMKNNIQYGKKDFLAILICIKLLIDKEKFSTLVNNINKLINKTYKELNMTKKELLYLMHLPENYMILKNI